MNQPSQLKILFLENRSVTDIWSGASHFLLSEFDCQLLRFNPAFGNSFPGKIVDQVIFPHSSDPLDPRVASFIQTIFRTDRAAYLHGTTETEIRDAVLSVFETLKQMKFDVVIGEVTSVYERAVDFYCRDNNITFLAPMTARIPADRFFFLDGSLLFPLPIASASDKIGLVSDGVGTAQSNAGKNDLAIALDYHVRIRNTMKTIAGWWNGERLHTPSPWRKVILNWKQKRGIASLASRTLAHIEDINNHSVIYCMHVQPESTLDTYSPELWDQATTVRAIAEACRMAQRQFFVRPHPRGKHECWLHLSKIQIPGVRILSPLAGMQELLKCGPTVVTVSGTVLLEAAAAGVPTVALGHSYLASFPGVTQVSLADFKKVLSNEIVCTRGTPELQREWFESVNRFSHQGLISPSEWSSEALSRQNLSDIAAAIRLAVSLCINHATGIPE